MTREYAVRKRVWVIAAVGGVAFLAGCGATSAGPVSPSPSARPSLSRPSGTPTDSSESVTPSDPTTVTATATATTTETTTLPPSIGPTRTVVITPSPSETAASTTTPSPAPSAATSTAWIWWVLGFVVLAAVVGFVLLGRRRSARNAWTAEFRNAAGEAAWLSTDLLPTLGLALGADARRGGWLVARPRVTALEGQLNALSASAGSELDRNRSTQLGAAVQAVRAALDAESTAAAGLEDVTRAATQQAQAQLAQTLRNTADSGGAISEP